MDKETRDNLILSLSLATINLTGEGDEGFLALVEKCISALKSDAQTITRKEERIAYLKERIKSMEETCRREAIGLWP